MDPQALSDKAEIRELLFRYARAVDDKDWALMSSVFTKDARLDYTSVDGPAGSATRSSGGSIVHWHLCR